MRCWQRSVRASHLSQSGYGSVLHVDVVADVRVVVATVASRGGTAFTHVVLTVVVVICC